MPIPDFSDRSIPDLLNLSGRCAVVTGGGSGIGLAIAHRLAEAGCDVVLLDVDRTVTEAAAVKLAESHGRRVVAVEGDVSNPGYPAAAIDAARGLAGRLDIWVNNAGICHSHPLSELSVEEWDLTHHVDLRGAFIGAQAASATMIAAGTRGVIVNMASISGFRGRPGHAHYTAAKHGVVGLTKSLGIELGPHNIRVVGIAPTLVATDGQRRHAAGQGSAVNDAIAKTIALGRVAVPDDIARVAVFLTSDLAAFMTGSTVFVDGGAGAF
jgi:NAD(P)-dependent dehydrogenase (short-subunit alcohol dehydrogenase family)